MPLLSPLLMLMPIGFAATRHKMLITPLRPCCRDVTRVSPRRAADVAAARYASIRRQMMLYAMPAAAIFAADMSGC